MKLDDKVGSISGIGPKTTIILEKLGIHTVEDFLFHIPTRYEDRRNIKKISELVSGERALITGVLEKLDNIFTRNGKRLTKAVVSDQTGKLDVIWFNQHYLSRAIKPGMIINLFGELDPRSKKPQFTAPDWDIANDSEPVSRLIPIYPLTEGITSKWMKGKIESVINNVEIPNLFDTSVAEKYDLEPRSLAFRKIHFPDNTYDIEAGRKTLAFEEILFVHLKGMKFRAEWNKKQNSHKIHLDKSDFDELLKSLPFKLTSDQHKVIYEIFKDLKGDAPMNRLLQGDVGSGKTVVAAAGILATFKSGYNAIFIAPTQILAEQHYQTLSKLLKPFGISVHLETGKIKSTPSDSKYVVVGTHAILHSMDKFSNIGLIVIDEQHKFGVDQRTRIVDFYTNQNIVPNLLTMTATPIPRSLALTFYGDLDLSQINTMPEGRKAVKTWLAGEAKRKGAYDWIRNEIKTNKHQAFVVCPFIEESDHEEFKNVKSAEAEYEKLKAYFKDLEIGLLHGKLKSAEKDAVLKDFANGKTDILVTTPVIEVGIDIPNANIILIETPERFGLASLHQLRGRVGRGGGQAYCLLMTQADQNSLRRLKFMETVHNGNKLAEIDLKFRGPGDIYGSNQHGFLDLKIADITDIDLIKTTRTLAVSINKHLNNHPEIKRILDKMKYVEEN